MFIQIFLLKTLNLESKITNGQKNETLLTKALNSVLMNLSIFLQKNHPHNNDYVICCILCGKDVNMDHQGNADLTKHVNRCVYKNKMQDAQKKVLWN